MKELRIIVAGSRTFNDYALLEDRLNFFLSECKPVIVCGEAKGADSLGRKYAEEHNIAIASYPADWNKYGKRAGYLRNEEMAVNADGAVVFWDGKSSGSKHMIETMKALGKPVKVVKYAR